MVDLNKIAKALRLFNEKADKLLRLSFMGKMQHPDSGVTISFERVNDKGEALIKQERRGPEEEAIDACVLTFRYFIQNNEQTSFANMETHYLDAPIDDELKQQFVELRKQVNEFLDGTTNMNFNNETLTRRRIMEVFVYGGFSHANEEKRTPAAVLFENEFLVIMRNIIVAIAQIRRMNENALESLPRPS